MAETDAFGGNARQAYIGSLSAPERFARPPAASSRDALSAVNYVDVVNEAGRLPNPTTDSPRLRDSSGAAATLSIAGCGGGNVARPTGQVLDKGTPVARALITFSAQIDDREIRLSGLTDADGNYRLDYGVHEGLPVGPIQVTIARTLRRDGSPAPPGEEGMHMLRTGEALLQKYEYQAELAPGSPQLDFDLAEASEERVTLEFGTDEF